MIIEERKGNLFDAGNDYSLAHCISADYALGAGIAVEFQRKYQLREKLEQIGEHKSPDCIYTNGVFNLVTKKNYWNKPTYQSLEAALRMMKQKAVENSVHKIAMPRIGCGLDRLQWPVAREIICKVFGTGDNEIQIAVYSL